MEVCGGSVRWEVAKGGGIVRKDAPSPTCWRRGFRGVDFVGRLAEVVSIQCGPHFSLRLEIFIQIRSAREGMAYDVWPGGGEPV